VGSGASPHRFGFITVAGPPNAGKSTLVNRLTGHKISIVSRRPQTTRHRIMGIRTLPAAQLVFVDTPGMHFDHRRNLNRQINRTATASLDGVDLVVFMIDHRGWNPSLVRLLRVVANTGQPVILVINKVDNLKDKAKLLPLIAESSALHDFLEIVPLSARHDDLEDRFLPLLASHVPEGPAGFPTDQLTDRGPGFQASELVREQTFALLGEELPYESAVEVTKFDHSDPDFWELDMIIWVEREGQKRIIIGKGGSVLKKLGSQARMAIERQFGVRVRLNLWVKQRQGWADNLSMLRSLGYSEE
jgi:GTP-binding protein Era